MYDTKIHEDDKRSLLCKGRLIFYLPMPREEKAAKNLELPVALAHWHPAHLRGEMQFKLSPVAHPEKEINMIAQCVEF